MESDDLLLFLVKRLYFNTLFNYQNLSANLAQLFIKTKQIFFTDSIILIQTGFTQGKKLKSLLNRKLSSAQIQT